MYGWARDRGERLTMDATEQVIHNHETRATTKRVKGLNLCGMGDGGRKTNTGRPGRLMTLSRLKLARVGTTCLQQRKQPPGGWKHTPCLMPLAGHYPGPREANLVETVLQKELSLTVGPKWVYPIAPITHQPLEKRSDTMVHEKPL